MIVYRVEDDNKRGPYSASWVDVPDVDEDFFYMVENLGFRHSDEEHPGLYDFPFSITRGKVFGFATIGQFRKWFNHVDLKPFVEYGFKLSRYFVYPEEVVHGKSGTQILFPNDDLRGRCDMMEYLT